jgi:hypothetical protein
VTTLLCSLAEAKLQINKSASFTGDDAELTDYIEAITDPIEEFCGAVLPNDVEKIVTSYSDVLILPSERVSAVASVTGYVNGAGTVWTAGDLTYTGSYGYRVDTDSGLIRALAGARFCGDYLVAYTEGFAEIPKSINIAARLLVADLWTTQQGGAGLPPVFEDDTVTVDGVALSEGRRAFELLSRYRRAPAVA